MRNIILAIKGIWHSTEHFNYMETCYIDGRLKYSFNYAYNQISPI